MTVRLHRRAWGARCTVCGARHRLEFAHLPGRPTGLCGPGRGSKERYRDIRDNPESYVLLCKKHHKQLDANLLVGD